MWTIVVALYLLLNSMRTCRQLIYLQKAIFTNISLIKQL